MRRQVIPPLCASLILMLVLVVTSAVSASDESGVKNFTTVAKKAIPAVVSISVESPMGSSYADSDNHFFDNFYGGRFKGQVPWMGQASGFFVSPDGYILTNNHVVKGAGKIKVLLNNKKEYDARVVGQDPNTDIAVLKIEGHGFEYLKLGNSDDLEVGQWVVAIGNPVGLQASLTVGVVSAKGRNNLDLAHIEDFIQTDAAINKGHSGGPLLDLDGNVVGMNTAIASDMGGYMGIGFAIPSTMANNIMKQIIDRGGVTRGFLGLTLQNVNKDLANAFDLENIDGAIVTEVHDGSPAFEAGIQQGDIIKKYDTTDVRDMSSFRTSVAMMQPGTEMNLTILRNGQEKTIPLVIGTFPGSGTEKQNSENKFGFQVESLTPKIAHSLGLLSGKGIIVDRVKTGSPAAWSGLKKGALILEVNKTKVTTPADFDKIIDGNPLDKPLLMLIKQGGQMRFISIKVG